MDGQSVDDGMAGVGNEGKIGCVVMVSIGSFIYLLQDGPDIGLGTYTQPLGRGLDDVLSGGSGFLYGDEGSNEAFASSLLQFVIPLSPIIRGVGQLQRLKMVHQVSRSHAFTAIRPFLRPVMFLFFRISSSKTSSFLDAIMEPAPAQPLLPALRCPPLPP